ncbi:hypothetical protein V8G54_033257 [Vigna mungo]|uniref:Dymeclin n=1 Tax=Vigna mungo TaxID=3915 RepID=A0AAQ3MPH4_VIGMU
MDDGWPVNEVLQVVIVNCRSLRVDGIKMFTQLHFTYEQESHPEEFFISYVWKLVLSKCSVHVSDVKILSSAVNLKFNATTINLFPVDIPIKVLPLSCPRLTIAVPLSRPRLTLATSPRKMGGKEASSFAANHNREKKRNKNPRLERRTSLEARNGRTKVERLSKRPYRPRFAPKLRHINALERSVPEKVTCLAGHTTSVHSRTEVERLSKRPYRPWFAPKPRHINALEHSVPKKVTCLTRHTASVHSRTKTERSYYLCPQTTEAVLVDKMNLERSVPECLAGHTSSVYSRTKVKRSYCLCPQTTEAILVDKMNLERSVPKCLTGHTTSVHNRTKAERSYCLCLPNNQGSISGQNELGTLVNRGSISGENELGTFGSRVSSKTYCLGS